MKRIASLFCGLLLAASLTACGSPAGEPGSSGPTSGGESSAVGESSAPAESSALVSGSTSLPGVTGPGPQLMEMKVFVQKDSGAEEGYEPTVRLLENGNFEFSLYLYDGTAFLSGTYAEEGDSYALTVTESSAQGFAASDVGEIRLTKTETGVTYSGEQIGVTCDGAEFAAADN